MDSHRIILNNARMIDEQLEARLKELVDVFLTENAKLNLSAFRTAEHCWIGNVLDSLAFLDRAPAILGKDFALQTLRMLDLGTGGGFPLLPLALAMPKARCIGIDAVRKKVDAVKRIIEAMQLKNAQLMCVRSEELAQHKDFRATFDVVTARAVAPIGVLLEYMIPFLKVHGHAVLWKSKHIAEEMRSSVPSSRALHAKLIESHTYALPGDWGERTLLIFQKIAPTADEYPREVGVPKSKPL